MNEEEKNEYANWILNECNSPISEIEWLVSNLPEDIQNEIINNVLKYLEQK